MTQKYSMKTLCILSGLLACSASHAADLTLTGFGSAVYGQAFTKDLLPFGISSNHKPNFTDFSLFGLNVNSKIDNNWSAGAQLVGLGDRSAATNNFNLQVSWASIAYKTEEGLGLRFGRQRFPIFTASEFIYEHQELPFREMPAIVFFMAPFVAFDGVSVSQSFDTGAGKLNFQAFGGTPILSVTPPVGTPVYSNLLGGRVNLEGDGWKVRAQISRSTAENTIGTAVAATANTVYYSVGYRYDKSNIVSWGEFLFRRAEDGTIQSSGHRYLGVGRAGYLLAGYRIGNLLPRYTFAKTSADLGTAGIGDTTTHTVGLNYAVNPKITVKADYELTLVPNSGGGFKVTPVSPAASATAGQALYAGIDFEI